MTDSPKESVSGRHSITAFVLVVLLAGVLFGSYRVYIAIRHRALLRASIPKALSQMRQQRSELAEAIEEYKQQYGLYPPAHTMPGQPPGAINPLFYELVGTRRDEQQEAFYDSTQKEPIRVEVMQKSFGMRCFTNSLPFPTWPKNFLTSRQLPKKEFVEGADVYGVAFNDIDLPNDVLDEFKMTPWRYLVSPAEHNPGKFDLWIEMEVAGKHYLIGNWPGADERVGR